MIKLIRESRDPEVARMGLIERFALSEVQARAILDMRLQRLTGLERDKLVAEFEELMRLVDRLNAILASPEEQRALIKTELLEMRERYGDERRTSINHAGGDFSMEDMIADEAMVITVSREGYIKRTSLDEYRTQGRGGVGARGAGSKQDDFTEHLFVATTHEYLLIFTEQGRMFWLRAYEVPETAKTSKGTPLQNLIDKPKEDAVRSVLNVRNLRSPDYLENTFLMFCTEQGTVKKTPLVAYSRPRAAGINAITINEGDRLLDVQLLTGNAEVVLALRSAGPCASPKTKCVPWAAPAGVRGITLGEEAGDRVVGMVCIADPTQELLVVSENGYGKRSALDEYRVTNRGGKGVRAMMLTEKTGKLVSIQAVNDADDLMIINRSGLTIRLSMSELRTIGRATQGVRLFKVAANDEISSVAKVAAAEVDEVELDPLAIEGVSFVVTDADPEDELVLLVGEDDDLDQPEEEVADDQE